MKQRFLYPELADYTKKKKKAEMVFKNARVLNVFTEEILQGDVACQDGVIVGIGAYDGVDEVDCGGKILVPGFLDGHLHMESTLVTPSELVKNTVRFGTTTYIIDPHEAANVAGAAGIDYLIQDTENVPANVFVMMPSCVPATFFEDNGASFSAQDMEAYREHPRVLGLGEVMDFPSVEAGEPSMMEKLALFQDQVIDGHAPNLTKQQLQLYVLAGVRTDHESSTFADALQKARNGMQVLIREGSAARNLDDIVRGVVDHGMNTDSFSFCTDDKHIEDIRREGHISHHIRRAIALGIPPIKAIQMATINTARTYGLRHLGAIRVGGQADLVLLDDLETVSIADVYYRGKNVREMEPHPVVPSENLLQTVHIKPVGLEQLALPVDGESDVIGVIPGQLITQHKRAVLPQAGGFFTPNGEYNKIAVVERHHATGKMAVGAIAGFGITGGAIASSVSHDSHNLIVVGDNDRDMILAIQELERTSGGYTIAAGGQIRHTLPLPILGLISDWPHEQVDKRVKEMTALAYQMGVNPGISPFITLSFMALPVIPELRLTARGMFDVVKFAFCDERRNQDGGTAG